MGAGGDEMTPPHDARQAYVSVAYTGVMPPCLALALLSPALALPQDRPLEWSSSEVRRVVATGYSTKRVLAWRTTEGIEGYIRRKVAAGGDEIPASDADDIAPLEPGTRVGLLETESFLAEAYNRYYYKVRVLSGPHKDAVCYVVAAYGRMDFLNGEPAIASGAKKIAGAFDSYTLERFCEASKVGDDRTVNGYLKLERVFMVPQGTRLTIESGLNDDANVRARVQSGAYKGKVLYFGCMDVQVFYPTVSSATPAKKVVKG